MTRRLAREDMGLIERAHAHRLGFGPWYAGAAVAVLSVLFVRAPMWPWTALIVGPVTLAMIAWSLSRLDGWLHEIYSLACIGSGLFFLLWARMLPLSMEPKEGRGFLSGAAEVASAWGFWLLCLFGSTVILGIGWWSSKSKRVQVHMEDDVRGWSEIAQNFGLAETIRVVKSKDMDGNESGFLVWPRGKYTTKQVLDAREKIEGGMGMPEGSLRLMKSGRDTDRIAYVSFKTNPLTESVLWPGPPQTDDGGDVSVDVACKVGPREDHETESLPYIDRSNNFVANKLLGGTQGCVAPWTRIYLPLTGEHVRVDELAARGQSIVVLADTAEGLVPARTAGAPFLKGEAELFEVQCSDGATIVVTDQHRFLTPRGWRQLADVRVGQLLASAPHAAPASAAEYRSASLAGGRCSPGTRAGCPDGCSMCRRPSDRQPHLTGAVAGASVPGPVGVLARSRSKSPVDGRDGGRGCSRACRRSSRLASTRCASGCMRVRDAAGSPVLAGALSRLSAWSAAVPRLRPESVPADTAPRLALSRRCGGPGGCVLPSSRCDCGSPSQLVGTCAGAAVPSLRIRIRVPGLPAVHLPDIAGTHLQGASRLGAEVLSSQEYDGRYTRVVSIRRMGYGPYFDMTVPGPANYVAEGLVNHNSGKSGGMTLHIADLACRSDATQWGMDMKDGMEIAPWEKVMDNLATTVDEASEMLEALDAIMDYRGQENTRCNRKNWPITPEHPLLVVWIDELHRLLGAKSGRDFKQMARCQDVMVRLATTGRALGISVNGATQNPTLEATATSQFRDRLNQRICFRTEKENHEDYILNARRAGSHLLDSSASGLCYLQDRDKWTGMPVRYYYVTDWMVEQIAEIRAPGLPLDEGSSAAAAAVSPRYRARIEGRYTFIDEEGDADGIATVTEIGDPVPETAFSGPNVPLTAVYAAAESAVKPPAVTATGEPLQGPNVSLGAMLGVDARLRTDGSDGGPRPDAAPVLEPLKGEDAVFAFLRHRGDRGAIASELFTASGYKSSWFHKWKVPHLESGLLVQPRGSLGPYVLQEFAMSASSSQESPRTADK